MKLKHDFVTNSSSCSYIVCIPDMEKAIKQICERIELTDDEINMLTSHKSGYIIFQDYYDDFHEIIEILEDLGYPVMFEECGPDNDCRMLNIAYNREMRVKIRNVMRDDE
jgi:hypothetical protein